MVSQFLSNIICEILGYLVYLLPFCTAPDFMLISELCFFHNFVLWLVQVCSLNPTFYTVDYAITHIGRYYPNKFTMENLLKFLSRA